jgi:metallo-beta-lactamase family protein
MKITFFGAARTVTGSMHLLEANGRRILLDCGLFQGPRAEAFRRNRELPFEAASVDRMILSHAHIDHSGNIPSLVRSGFRGDILCTPATRDLCGAMLRDSAHIQEADARLVNKIDRGRGIAPVEPLYTVADAEAALTHLVGLSYGRPFDVAPGVRLTFRDAGHILGAAITLLDVTEGARAFRFAFTGDLGRRGLPILRDPELVPDIDVLITESTYGNSLHGAVADVEKELEAIVAATAARGGKVVIPAFAVGRTQEIVFALHRLNEAGRIPAVPVFVDSPLALDATEVFRIHPEVFDAETVEHLRRGEDPFGFRRLRYVRTVEESKALNDLAGPAVIISASGMAESGRVLHHLAHTIGDPANTILLVSWQAPHTLGRRLLDGEETVPILGRGHRVRAVVKVIGGFSAHADRDELAWWIGAAAKRLKTVFVVHGEETAALALAGAVRAMGVPRVEWPSPGESYDV